MNRKEKKSTSVTTKAGLERARRGGGQGQGPALLSTPTAINRGSLGLAKRRLRSLRFPTVAESGADADRTSEALGISLSTRCLSSTVEWPSEQVSTKSPSDRRCCPRKHCNRQGDTCFRIICPVSQGNTAKRQNRKVPNSEAGIRQGSQTASPVNKAGVLALSLSG